MKAISAAINENRDRPASKSRVLLPLLSQEISSKPSSSLRQIHKSSFLLHLRPLALTWETAGALHTLHLGILAFFLFILEAVTGLALMIYYVPTPLEAYPSILRLMSQAPFGDLLRDLHRLGGEAMLVVAALHLLRTFLTDSYRKERAFTWLTGVMLLLIIFGLAFSGYLLPWDQRSYWAVTIGTSMAEAAPLIGRDLSMLLRGGPVIGGDGLLRFYLAHVFFLPLLTIFCMAVHYYRVSRLHGISLPAHLDGPDPEKSSRTVETKPVAYLPFGLRREAIVFSLCLLLLLAWAYWFYDAPLESHANPRYTPLNSEAPWFFLWLQGLLKLGDKLWAGVVIPLAVLLALLVLPYLNSGPRKKLLQRPVSLLGCLLAVGGIMLLSFMGTPDYGINLPPATRIMEELAPEENQGLVHHISDSGLKVGIYELGNEKNTSPPPSLAGFLDIFQTRLRQASQNGELPQATGVLLVEEWQADLIKITVRIIWGPKHKSPRPSLERTVYLHKNRRL